MAREHAKIRLDIWADDEWRELDVECQHLYLLLLSHPTLNYVGVADWRPGRIAQLAKGMTADGVRETAGRLRAGGFVLADDDTEEILVRSFVKHDGLLKQPKLAVSMANAFGATASNAIRSVVAFEVQKQRERAPELAAWSVKQVQTVLEARGTPIDGIRHGFTPGFTPDLGPGFTPDLGPGFTPNGGQAQGLPTTTATTTATEASLLSSDEPKKKSMRLPSSWSPTADHVKRAQEAGINLLREAEAFRLHAETHDRHAANWNSAFTTWLKKSKPSPGGSGRKFAANDEWMYR
ncbi:hypothetical protein [Microbacterium gubbeenense]|uniref:hypothetical protein n=1 Tax=Microbacterium gubbeenense TaxID=159896 RepID=UPI003F9BB4AB